LEKLEEGLSTGEFESWMRRALRMEHLSLKRLRGEGLGGKSFTGYPEIYVKKVSGYGHISPWVSISNRGKPVMWGESSNIGDFNR
jgi:hypothetical protein